MAPPPEYDKEPKAPDKSASNISCEETKSLNNVVNDHQNIWDSITASTSASADAENKHVETLDDGALRALLDEAITYKCPKDREGKSSLFKELLEEVEQDEQACEAAARNLNVGRRQRNSRGGSSRHSVAQSNSLQDLVAALAAEPMPRRHHRHHNTPPATTVSARALHGGSLPSGVDTSFLLGEEGSAPRGANYLATVRCVNPPPLGERRVSASDAPQDDTNRRSKPTYPMTYTARATLEIGSGGSGTTRAVTTTTASNQVRTTLHPPLPTHAPTIAPITQNANNKTTKTNRSKQPQKILSWKVTEIQPRNKFLAPKITKSKAKISKNNSNKINQPHGRPIVAAQKLAKPQSLTESVIPIAEELLAKQQCFKHEVYQSTQSTMPWQLTKQQQKTQPPKFTFSGQPRIQHPGYKRAPTIGPPERLFNTSCHYPKLYNHKSHPIYQYEGNKGGHKYEDQDSDLFTKMKNEIDLIERTNSESKGSGNNLTENNNLESKSQVKKVKIQLEEENSPRYILLRALIPKTNCDNDNSGGGGGEEETNNSVVKTKIVSNNKENPRNFRVTKKKSSDQKGKQHSDKIKECKAESSNESAEGQLKSNVSKVVGNNAKPVLKSLSSKDGMNSYNSFMHQMAYDNGELSDEDVHQTEEEWSANVNNWYSGLISTIADLGHTNITNINKNSNDPTAQDCNPYWAKLYSRQTNVTKIPFITLKERNSYRKEPVKQCLQHRQDSDWAYNNMDTSLDRVTKHEDFHYIRQEYKQLIGENLAKPENNEWNPRNIRKMTIGKPVSEYEDFDSSELKIEDHDDSKPQWSTVDNQVQDNTNTDEDDVEFFDALEDNKVESKCSANTYISFCDEINKSMSLSNIRDENNIPIFETEIEQINIKDHKLVKDFIKKATEIGDTSSYARELVKMKDISQENVANAELADNIKSAATVEHISPNIANANKITVVENIIKSDDVASTSLDSVKTKVDSTTEDISPENVENADKINLDMPDSIIKCGNQDVASPTAFEAVKGNRDSFIFVDTSSFDKIGSCCVTNVADSDAHAMSSKEQLDLNIGLNDIPKHLDTVDIGLKDIPNDEIGLKDTTEHSDTADIELKEIPKDEIELNDMPKRLNTGNIELKHIPKEEIELKDIPKQLETDDIELKTIPKATEEEGDIELVDMSPRSREIDSKEIDFIDVKKDSNEGTGSQYYVELVQRLIDSLKYSSVDKDNSDSFLGYKNEKVQNCDEEVVTETNNIFLEDDVKIKYEVLYKDKLPVIKEIDEDSLNTVEDTESISEDEIDSYTSEALRDNYLLKENIARANAKHTNYENCKTIKEMPKQDIQIKNKEDSQSDSQKKNSAVNIINVENEEKNASNANESQNLTYIMLDRPAHFITVDTSNSRLAIENDATENETQKEINAESIAKKKLTLDRNVLRHILMSRLFNHTATDLLPEVDSAIPFSCITTPKVVASCNTTSSSTQAATAVDSKPLQLGWSYRAVASLTEGALEPDAADHNASSSAAAHSQPRSVISSSFNGLPLTRPNYGTMSASTEEYKKPLDENGNSVQGFSSPLSGSSQHKKPRRKKSSKNEVVITSHQIDGYQGNKDLNEVLRFIESNADAPRGSGNKLRKARHDDEDKPKKRERRKDKQPPQRAASLEEIAVSSLRELTTSRPPPAKPERRSWGDDFRPEDEGSPGEFQTVTKKRRWRRRETPAPAPPTARARRVSAPPSDRSDSNDDDSIHSLHSLPALNAGESTRAPASYAEIARAANIPDLIESCNFYTEEPRPAPVLVPPPQDDYPALEPRRRAASTTTAATNAAVSAKPLHNPNTAQRRDKKDRSEITSTCVGSECTERACPAPDVVSEGRPPVILLDSTRHNDIAGITFGFDINHQLLTGDSRRRGCDLVRDAVEGATDEDECDTTPEHTPPEAADDLPVESEPEVTTEVATEAESIACADGVRKSINTVRYLPPAYTPLTPHLVQIIDYVAQAWDEVLRCGGGKVRYFSE